MRIPLFLQLMVGSALVLSAGCSALPGLRVLGGEDPAAISGGGNSVVALSDLVMADKTDATDPSLMMAADRIEAASGDVDIIEIRKDDLDDMFVVNLLYRPPANADPNTQEGLVLLYDSLRRAVEVTWQATMAESEGYDTLRVSFIQPQSIPTLDNGNSFVGLITSNAEIARSDAIVYLSTRRDINTFIDLIATGTMSFEAADGELYQGSPNHPMFMLPTPMNEQTAAQQQ